MESGRKLKISPHVRWCQSEFPSIYFNINLLISLELMLPISRPSQINSVIPLFYNFIYHPALKAAINTMIEVLEIAHSSKF